MRAQLQVTDVEVHGHQDGSASIVVSGRDPITGDKNRIGVLTSPGERRPQIGDTLEHTVALQLMPRRVRRLA